MRAETKPRRDLKASLIQGVGLAGTAGRKGGMSTVPKGAPERHQWSSGDWGSLGPGGGRGDPHCSGHS